MRNSLSKDYEEVVEKIIKDPESYNSWSPSAEDEAVEIKNLINDIAWSRYED